MDHIGGGKCSICKSNGVSVSTCPLNPKAKKPNIKGHYLAKSKKKISHRKTPSKNKIQDILNKRIMVDSDNVNDDIKVEDRIKNILNKR